MTLLHSPRVAHWAGRHLLCRIEGEADRFALTFDDGPSLRNTPRLLDVLARRGVRATFFLLAPHVRRHPELARRLVAEGHEIGLHGETHLPPIFQTASWLQRTLESGQNTLTEVCGVKALYYRPPFGVLAPAQTRRLREWGYEPVLGDVYPEDPRRPGTARIAERVLSRLRGGSIVILHDASVLGDADRSQTIDAVATILEVAAARGLSPVTVGALARRAVD
jgi:peptidoglycan/xylan/chitin deacetylase (PgdA/CDA1 family)